MLLEDEKIKEVIQSELFRSKILKKIREIHVNRHKILERLKGKVLKRTEFDYLIDNNLDNSKDMVEEFNKVLYKQSKLPSSVRAFIHDFCIVEFIESFKELKKDEENINN